MPISNDLLEILCCPKTKVPVVMLSADQLERLNSKIAQGQVHNVGSESIDQPLEEGLITEDGQTIYRIDEGIPVMLIEKGIAAGQLQD